jgi:transketolase
MALGAAIAERFIAARLGDWFTHKTYVYISDGGIQEEVAQGVGRLAGHLGLSNFIMFYDSNSVQLSTPTSQVTSEDTAKKYEAWGWRVTTIDGNSIPQIRRALSEAVDEKERPTLIIGKTVMGKGALDNNGASFEGRVETHGTPLSKAGASVEKSILNCGGDPGNPFDVFPEVKEFFADVIQTKTAAAQQRHHAEAAWEKENPVLAAKFHQFWTGQFPEITYEAIRLKADAATRATSGAVLTTFAQQVENMIVSSADLCNSDNTEGFLKGGARAFAKGDFTGGFLQAGVSELTMAGVMNGIALHGGVIPVGGTFFVFSDFMKPAVRLAALMGLPVKYVWTHDSFRVGEDGPTHQPIEHETQIRLMEKMHNREGKSTMLVLRPADAAETIVAWQLAIENKHSPTGILLSRQGMPDLPARSGSSRIVEAQNARHGAYTVFETGTAPSLICIANGAEVITLVNAAKKLWERKSLSIRVVSIISEGLFFEQTAEYRESVIPFDLPVFGLTSGLPQALKDVAGPFGFVYGLNHFGESAPFQVLEEKFGFSLRTIVDKIESYLESHGKVMKRLSANSQGA